MNQSPPPSPAGEAAGARARQPDAGCRPSAPGAMPAGEAPFDRQRLPAASGAAPDILAGRLRALAHPVRLAMLETLARAQGCVCGEIVRHFPLAQSTVSQHLKVLVEAGLVRARTEGPRTAYCLDPQALAALRSELDHLLAHLAADAPCADVTDPC